MLHPPRRRKTTRHTRQQVAAAEALRTLVLANGRGVEVHISPVGAAIMQLLVPDRTGELADIALGFDSNGPYAVRAADRKAFSSKLPELDVEVKLSGKCHLC